MLRIYETINKKMERSECAMRQKKKLPHFGT